MHARIFPPTLGRLLSNTATQVLSLVCLGPLRVRISLVMVIPLKQLLPSRQNTSVDVRFASCSLCHSLESTGKVLSMGAILITTWCWGGGQRVRGRGMGTLEEGLWTPLPVAPGRKHK